MPMAVRPADAVSTAVSNTVNGDLPATNGRLILCFDGTGNVFTGTPGDTNIVKLYKLFDRENNDQMHYYQPGIGTYPAEGPVNVNIFRSFIRKIQAVLDSALATSFDSHVIAGYRFIMRYYKPGDRIYIFGFSRGAFTARFVSRMISHIGLLSRGNEELIPFAYKVYQDYEANRDPEKSTDQVKYMNSFKDHFCRTETNKKMKKGKLIFTDDDANVISENESGIKVDFLGLFDCVSSVGNLDVPFFQKAPPLPAVTGTANHIRHAVAIDERRVKFKAALFAQEPNPSTTEDIKEVWFPGNHGDIGGGWDVVKSKEDAKARTDHKNDYFQLSDIALKWMIDEIDAVEAKTLTNPADRLAWDPIGKTDFLNRFELHKDEMIKARMHDTMAFGGGGANAKVVLWKWMECIPFIIRRWEYKPKQDSGWFSWFGKAKAKSKDWHWDYIGFPPNFGGRRDIPSTALFHNSVFERMKLEASTVPKKYYPQQYVPNNQISLSHGDRCTAEDSVDSLHQLIPTVREYNLEATGTQPLPSGTMILDLQPAVTIGSMDVVGRQDLEGESANAKFKIGPQVWDHIYRVKPRVS